MLAKVDFLLWQGLDATITKLLDTSQPVFDQPQFTVENWRHPEMNWDREHGRELDSM
jgi:hypothetical protein